MPAADTPEKKVMAEASSAIEVPAKADVANGSDVVAQEVDAPKGATLAQDRSEEDHADKTGETGKATESSVVKENATENGGDKASSPEEDQPSAKHNDETSTSEGNLAESSSGEIKGETTGHELKEDGKKPATEEPPECPSPKKQKTPAKACSDQVESANEKPVDSETEKCSEVAVATGKDTHEKAAKTDESTAPETTAPASTTPA